MKRRARAKRRAVQAVAPAPPAISRRAAALCAGSAFATVFVIYLLTITPTVTDQDCGELVAAAHVLGIAHPTGYPLWTLLGRAFDLLPVGHTSAYRVALLSAVSGAGAAAGIAWLTAVMSGLALPAFFAGVSLGVWLPLWSQAVRPEVYALECLLIVLFLILLWRWDRTRSPRDLGWLALAGGLCAMHHRTGFLAIAPALATAFWLTRPRRARTWLSAAALLAAPLLFYLYLPLRAASHPPMNWGDPGSADRLLAHVLARQYSGYAFGNSLEVAQQQAIKLLGESLAGEGWRSIALGLVGFPAIFWGALVWCRRRPAMAVSLILGSLLLMVWVVDWSDTSDSKVWLTPAGAGLALFGGLGLARLAEKFPRRRVGSIAASGVGAVVCLLLLQANWGLADQSNLWRHRDHWRAILAQMDRNAIFLADFDNALFAMNYLQHVEKQRRDVTVLSPQQLSHPWYVDQIQEAELRRTTSQLWSQISSELQLTRSEGTEFWQGVSLLAYRLARHYGEARTVYAIHTPLTVTPPGPPYFIGLGRDLVRLDFAYPKLEAPAKRLGKPLAEFQGGVSLMSLDLEKEELSAGELVDFRARWRLDYPLPGSLLGLKLVPISGEGAAADRRERLMDRGNFLQELVPIYGLWGLGPTSAGTVYEQRGSFIVPSNAPAGQYALQVGLATQYPPPQYQAWQEVGPETGLRVRAAPLPKN